MIYFTFLIVLHVYNILFRLLLVIPNISIQILIYTIIVFNDLCNGQNNKYFMLYIHSYLFYCSREGIFIRTFRLQFQISSVNLTDLIVYVSYNALSFLLHVLVIYFTRYSISYCSEYIHFTFSSAYSSL